MFLNHMHLKSQDGVEYSSMLHLEWSERRGPGCFGWSTVLVLKLHAFEISFRSR